MVDIYEIARQTSVLHVQEAVNYTAHCYGHLAEAKVLQILITFAYNVSFIGVNQKATVHRLMSSKFLH